MDKISVLIADDHATFRESLQRVLQDQSDIDVVGLAGDGGEALDRINEVKPDVAIIDIAMPKSNGIEVAKQIKSTCPHTAVLLLSAYDNEPYVLSAIEAGAEGYLLKHVHVSEVADAVRTLYDGGTIFDADLVRKVFRLLGKRARRISVWEESEVLNQREQDVLRLVAKGMMNKEIARELTISVRTVQTHLVHVFRKLNVSSRTEAVLYAIKRGWLSLDDIL